MAGEIKHQWTGTVLTITSDSGTSSVDLKGDTGATGARGAQGATGVIYNQDGTPVLLNYATKEYVDIVVGEATEDIPNLATKSYVDTELTKYATTAEVSTLVPTITEEVLNAANICYVSNTLPTADIGKEGDIYIMMG